MGILLCEQNFRDVWIRNKSVRAEIGQILHTDTHPHTHTTAAKLVVRMTLTIKVCFHIAQYPVLGPLKVFLQLPSPNSVQLLLAGCPETTRDRYDTIS